MVRIKLFDALAKGKVKPEFGNPEHIKAIKEQQEPKACKNCDGAGEVTCPACDGSGQESSPEDRSVG
jgi:DnaJ-class molecular chaperone